MIEVGRLAVKTAGRDAGKMCVVIDLIDNNYVLIDGETRRRKCNITHLEPLDDVVALKKGASHEEVVRVLKEKGVSVTDTKKKDKKAEAPARKRKEKAVVEEKTSKKKK